GDGCGHTLLTPHSGTLSSKNYPGTYPHTACRWRLHAPPGTSLLLTFGDLDLEPSERCTRSSLLLLLADPQAGTAYGKDKGVLGKTEAA
ncbi:Discoidin, CUB and LCCL domain-containing protein 2, partial [Antrostomus carolinensis]